MNTLKKIKELQENIANLNRQLKPLKADVMKQLEGRKTPLTEGKFNAVLKITLANRFDTTAFKADHIKLYNEFTVEQERKQLVIA